MRIARLSERFEITLGEVIITVAPLSGRQKIEMTSMIKQGEDGKLKIDKPAQELFLIKHSIRSIKGLKDLDDNEYQLRFKDESGALTDECAEEILGFLANTWFTHAITGAMKGLTGAVINPFTEQPIEGVSVSRQVEEGDEKK